MFSYIDTDGNQTDNLSQDEVMRLHATNGFEGQIVKPAAAEQDAEPVSLAEVPPTINKGDPCPMDGCTGQVIQGRSGLGCSAYRDGCKLHECLEINPRGTVFKPSAEQTTAPTRTYPLSVSSPIPGNLMVDIPAAVLGAFGNRAQRRALDDDGRAALEAVQTAAEQVNDAAAEVAAQVETYRAETGALRSAENQGGKGGTWSSHGVTSTCLARVTDQAEELGAMGFHVADTAVTLGTVLNAYGERALGQSRLAHEELPTLRDAAQEIAKVIGAEKREQRLIKLGQIRAQQDDAGKIQFVDQRTGEPLNLERGGMAALAGHGLKSTKDHPDNLNGITGEGTEQEKTWNRRDPVLPGMGFITNGMKGDEFCEFFNGRVTRPRFADEGIQLLTRTLEGQAPSIYSVAPTTWNYSGCDREILSFAEGAGAGWRASVKYNVGTTQLTVEAQDHIDTDSTVDFGAGDVFKLMLKFKSGDGYGQGVSVMYGFLRNLCMNLIILQEALQNAYKGRHSNKSGRIISAVGLSANASAEKFAEFREKHGFLGSLEVEALGYESVFDAVAEIVKSKELNSLLPNSQLSALVNMKEIKEGAGKGKSAKVNRDLAVEQLMQTMIDETLEEDGQTVVTPATLYNAITRLHSKVAITAKAIQADPQQDLAVFGGEVMDRYLVRADKRGLTPSRWATAYA